MRTISVLLYENFTALNCFGPVEVLSSLPDAVIRFVSEEGGIVKNGQGIRIETEPASSVEPGGILLIPGGFGSRAKALDQAFLSLVKQLCEKAEYVLCVCTGSALAAKAGVLHGRRATSNKRAFDWVRSCGEAVTWDRDARWVRDGKFYTSAGVSVGTDMALGFVADHYGAETAMDAASRMEYHWHRDAAHDDF